MKTNSVPFILLLVLLSGVACSSCGPDVGNLSAPATPQAVIRVIFRNQSRAPIKTNGLWIDVGDSCYCEHSALEENQHFDISRSGTPMARIVYSILKLPDTGVTQVVTIVITEPTAGVFSASTSDVAWIEILGVQSL